MIAGYLLAIAVFFPYALVIVTTGLCWLALYLIEKGGWRRLIGVALTVFIVVSALLLIAGA